LVRFSHRAHAGIGDKALVSKPAVSPAVHFPEGFSQPFLTRRRIFALRPLTQSASLMA